MGKFKSLEEVVLNYAYILIDNCAFQGICTDVVSEFVKEELKNYLMQQESYGSKKEEIKSLEKIRDYLIQKESLEFWGKNIKYYRNCYTISEVIKEMKRTGHYSYKEQIKKYNLNKIPYLPKLRREIKKLNAAGSLLIMSLEDEQRIYQFDREEQNLYDEFHEKHFKLENNYCLHRADFPLLISGAVITQTRGSCAIISNDFGIVRAWEALLKKESFSRKRFGFLVRKDVNLFEKL